MKKYKLNNDFNKNFIVSDLTTYEEMKYDNKYNTEFNVQVFSDGYSGKSEFIVDINDLREFIIELYNLNKTLKGTAVIKDLSIGSYVEFEIDKMGRIIVSGILFDNHKKQSLSFKFEVDQTYIKELSDELYHDIVCDTVFK